MSVLEAEGLKPPIPFWRLQSSTDFLRIQLGLSSHAYFFVSTVVIVQMWSTAFSLLSCFLTCSENFYPNCVYSSYTVTALIPWEVL